MKKVTAFVGSVRKKNTYHAHARSFQDVPQHDTPGVR
jgi:hypothetical protein